MKAKVILLVILFSAAGLSSCSTMKGIDQSMTDRARKQMEEGKKEDLVWKENIYNNLFVGMSQENFESKFKDNITKKDEGVVYFLEPTTANKARVTFKDKSLIKYERYGVGGNPWGYADCTFALKSGI